MKKFLTTRTREDGFTLIELLVVVIIIAILAAIAVPVYIGIQNNAKKSGLQSDVATTKLNLAAALTEDGTIASGTYNTTGKSGDATVQNSGVNGDEVVTVVYNTDGTFTVSAKSAKLNYTAAADSKSGQQTSQTGPTAQDMVTIASKANGTSNGTYGVYYFLAGNASTQQNAGQSGLATISSNAVFSGWQKGTFKQRYYYVNKLLDANGNPVSSAISSKFDGNITATVVYDGNTGQDLYIQANIMLEKISTSTVITQADIDAIKTITGDAADGSGNVLTVTAP